MLATRQLAVLATAVLWHSAGLGRAPKSLFFFAFPFSLFSFLFAVLIDLLLGLLSVKNLLRKRHRDGQFLLWSSQVLWQGILLWVFHSPFWAFLCISRAPFGQSSWSGNHWKDVNLLQKLSIDDANFGQKWWRQKWKKGRGSSRPVMAAGKGINGLKDNPLYITEETMILVSTQLRADLAWPKRENETMKVT